MCHFPLQWLRSLRNSHCEAVPDKVESHLEHSQKQATDGQTRKILHESIRKTDRAPAKSRCGDDPVEAQSLDNERRWEFSENIERVEERDCGVELGADQVDVRDHALRGSIADIAAVQKGDELEEDKDWADILRLSLVMKHAGDMSVVAPAEPTEWY
jgi:hypothetical protein